MQRHEYYMGLARMVATASKCHSRQVGCVILDEQRRIIGTGYNGPPKGITQCAECAKNPCYATHAEVNALINTQDIRAVHTLYVTTSPCWECAKIIANTSCAHVIFESDYQLLDKVSALFTQTGITLEKI